MSPEDLARRIGKYQQDMTDKIERLEALEDRLNVSLSGLSAFYDLDCSTIPIRIRGEFRSTTGLTIPQKIMIEIAAYDQTARIVGTTCTTILPEHFLGVAIFDLSLFPSVATVTRIRIFPRLC